MYKQGVVVISACIARKYLYCMKGVTSLASKKKPHSSHLSVPHLHYQLYHTFNRPTLLSRFNKRIASREITFSPHITHSARGAGKHNWFHGTRSIDAICRDYSNGCRGYNCTHSHFSLKMVGVSVDITS